MDYTTATARFELTFTAQEVPRLRTIQFWFEGERTPGPIAVAGGRASRDSREISWDRGLKALTYLLVRYRLTPIQDNFHERVDDSPMLLSVWNAVSTPRWIDDICGDSPALGHICKHVFFARGKGDERSLEICRKTLPPHSVNIIWNTSPSRPLDDLLGLLENHNPKRSHKNTKVVVSPSLGRVALEDSEGILASNAGEHRLSKSQLDELNRQGIAARLRRANGDDLYILSELGILAGVIEGKKTLQEIADFTSLGQNAISKYRSVLRQKVTQVDGVFDIIPQAWDTVILDWTDTLVDEFALDDAICDFIPTSANGIATRSNYLKFLALLNDLERQRSKLWYDYLYLGEQFKKTPEDIRVQHVKNKSKIRKLCDVNEVLAWLKRRDIKVILATNCHSQVLKWRAKMLGISMDTFDYVVTSDLVDDVKDKRRHFELIKERYHLSSERTVMVSDDREKDLAPAKMMGFATVWIVAPFSRPRMKTDAKTKSLKSHQDGSMNRSVYGTPTLPPVTHLVGNTRKFIGGRVVDYCLSTVDDLPSIIQT